jgi:DNA-binding transcriptional regulator YdaS (Cro superfamily)
MTENRFAHEDAPRSEAATDEPASSLNPCPDDPEEEFAFASEAEAEAYHTGLCDGIRAAGGTIPPRLEARARAAYPELFGEPAPQESGDLTDFDPAPLRHRHDGLTPDRQREYVEALADTGVARAAAARIGVSEQAVNRVRRRADARAFDLACEAAIRHGARRLRAIAFERAIEGTVKRHYWHGEVKSEERVYDNRLLIYLLGHTAHLLDEPKEAKAVVDHWEPWVEAIGEGAPSPVLSKVEGPASSAPAADPGRGDFGEAAMFNGTEVWEADDGWRTSFPPPDGFEGYEEGDPGDWNYERELTAAEQAVIEADEAADREDLLADQARRRDIYFGFLDPATDDAEQAEDAEDFSLREAETCETSGEVAPE